MGIMRLAYRSDYLSCTDLTICFPTNKLTTRQTPPPPPKEEKGGVVRPAGEPKFKVTPDMKFQVVWFLHGGGDDDTYPFRLTSLERYAEDNCVVLVAPQCGNSMFNNSVSGTQFVDHFVKELQPLIQMMLPISTAREDNFLMGFAMGGNGALGLGLLHPELFSAVVDLSGGIGLTLDEQVYADQMEWMGGGRMKLMFRDVDTYKGTDHDLMYLAKKDLASGEPLPEIFIGVGEHDFIQYRVKKDYEHLRDLNWPGIHYEEGINMAHEFNFWDNYFKKALYEWLPLKKAPIYE